MLIKPTMLHLLISTTMAIWISYQLHMRMTRSPGMRTMVPPIPHFLLQQFLPAQMVLHRSLLLISTTMAIWISYLHQTEMTRSPGMRTMELPIPHFLLQQFLPVQMVLHRSLLLISTTMATWT